eukprot:scaffold155_cov347-Pavlova_lutheri.AAC.85
MFLISLVSLARCSATVDPSSPCRPVVARIHSPTQATFPCAAAPAAPAQAARNSEEAPVRVPALAMFPSKHKHKHALSVWILSVGQRFRDRWGGSPPLSEPLPLRPSQPTPRGTNRRDSTLHATHANTFYHYRPNGGGR